MILTIETGIKQEHSAIDEKRATMNVPMIGHFVDTNMNIENGIKH